MHRGVSNVVAYRKKVCVESLVSWAYRDELPKEQRGEGGARIIPDRVSIDGPDEPRSIRYGGIIDVAPMFRIADLGVSVDWSREPGLPPAMGDEAHPDAHAIEAAVAQLQDVGMDWAASRDRLAYDLLPWASLDDPALVHMSIQTQALVILHACMGTRPEWHIGDPKLVRVLGKNLKPVVNGITAGRRYAEGAHCPLQLDPQAQEIVCARAEYAAWIAGLHTVHETLTAWGMQEHICLPPSAAIEPWITGENNPTVHKTGNADVRKLPLGPSRDIYRAPVRADRRASPVRKVAL